MSSLKPKLLYQLAVSFLYSAAPVLVFPFVSRILGPDHIGRINFIDYTAQFFILFSALGIPLYGVREVAKTRHEPAKLKILVSELFVIHVIVSCISLFIFLGLVIFQKNTFSERDLVILGGVNILANALALDWLIQGLEDFSFFGKRSYFIKIISIVLIFCFIHEAKDYILYYSILVGANVLITIADLLYALKKKITFTFEIKPSRHLASLLFFFMTTATISLYTYLDTMILGIISGSLAVGFYTTGLKTIRLTQNFVNDLGGVLLPRMSYLIQKKETEAIYRLINKSLYYVITVSIPLGIFFLLMAPEVIYILAGNSFTESIIVVRILSILPLIIGLSNVFGIQILLPFGKEKKVFIAVLSGSLVSIVLNIFLCKWYSEVGAALACVAAELIVTASMGLLAYRQLRFTIAFSIIFQVFISSILFYPIIYGIRLLIDSMFLRLILSGVICVLLFALLQLFFFSNLVLKEIVNYFTFRIFKRNLFTV